MNRSHAIAVIGSLNASVEQIKFAWDIIIREKITNDVLLLILRKSKVQTQAYLNLIKIKDDNISMNLMDELLKDYQLSKSRVHMMGDILNWLDDIAFHNPIKPILIKGSSLHYFYPEDQTRYSRDVDILLQEPRELWSLTAKLRGYNCEPKGAWYFSQRADRHEPYFLTGHWKRQFDEGELKLDLHCGFYSTMFLQKLSLPNLDEITVTVRGRKAIRELRPEASFILLLGHAVSHQGLRIRDINDASVLLRRFPDLDLSLIEKYINLNGLEFVAEDLYNWLYLLYPESAININFIKKNNFSKNKEWPLTYSWYNIIRKHWCEIEKEKGYLNTIKEIIILSWGNYSARNLSPQLVTENYKYKEILFKKISKFRHKNTRFGYMSCPTLLEVDFNAIKKVDFNEPLLNILHIEGYSAEWDLERECVYIKTNDGDLLLTEGGIFMISENLLFDEDLINHAKVIIEHIGNGENK